MKYLQPIMTGTAIFFVIVLLIVNNTKNGMIQELERTTDRQQIVIENLSNRINERTEEYNKLVEEFNNYKKRSLHW